MATVGVAELLIDVLVGVLIGVLVGVLIVEPYLDTQSVYAEFLALATGAPNSPWPLSCSVIVVPVLVRSLGASRF